jgi:cob(I)alamin adenosyltransferase
LQDRKKRLVHVYTGPGKGKTTAAVGLAFRASGHGWKVLMIQFMKGNQEYGEIQSAKNMRNIHIEQYGRSDFVKEGNPSPVDKKLALDGLKRARKVIIQSQYDLVILDEIIVAVDFGLIPLQELLSLIQQKPDRVELVLTGRKAHRDIIQRADLVSYIEEVKHPFQKGLAARKGIEF